MDEDLNVNTQWETQHGDLRLKHNGKHVSYWDLCSRYYEYRAQTGRTSPFIVGISLTLTLVVSFKISKKLQFDVIQLWMLEWSNLSFKFKVKFKRGLNLKNEMNLRSA